MPDYFASPKRKLARAKKHIADLERERDRFIEAYSGSHIAEINPDSGLKEFKIVLPGFDFGEFSDIASDAFQNLRNALDHVCAASSWASGKTSARPCAYFPIGKTSDDVERAIKGKCKDLPPEIQTLLRAFKPYKTGNRHPFLWALADTANVDKHALIRPYIPHLWNVTVGSAETIERPRLTFLVHPFWNAEKNEIVYATAAGDVAPQYDIHPNIDIALADGHGIDNIPALLALNLIADVVERVLMTVEAETRRLFPNAFR
jgi:hypothetical protein